jgi:thiol-disulfide isomerase/thioredoxin
MKRTGTLVAAMGMLVAQAFAQEVPRPAPEFVIHMANGSQLQLSQYTGKIVLLGFMFTTCPHCQAAIPILNGIQKDYASRGVQILGTTFNEGAASLVPAFIARFQPIFPVGSSPREAVQEFQAHPPFKRSYVPEFIFIDRKRVIREQHSGEEQFFMDEDKNIRAVLDNMLKEQPDSAKKGGTAAKKAVKKAT